MEKVNDISILIGLLPQYRLLNSLYQKIVVDFVLDFESQCHITDFYNNFKDKQVFEKAILNLLISTDKEKQVQIISNLRTEIFKISDLYIANKEFFDEINTSHICTKRQNPIRVQIDEHQKDANEFWRKLTQVRNSLESASWNNDKIAIKRLTKEEERIEGLYKKEQAKLEPLYIQQKESDNHAIRYITNQFGNIYELGCAFISLLESYYPVEKENILESEPTSVDAEIISEKEQEQDEIDPNMIFRTGKYEKFLTLEPKLIADKYLNKELHWVSTHENGKPDIKRLITFLAALLDNGYFLPNKNPKIKTFFELRYQITIGQNFERKRRESLLGEYKAVFYDYPF